MKLSASEHLDTGHREWLSEASGDIMTLCEMTLSVG